MILLFICMILQFCERGSSFCTGLIFRKRLEFLFIFWSGFTSFIILLLLTILTHLFPKNPFSTPWKQNCRVFWCFHGVEKGCIGNKWVNHRLPRCAQILMLFDLIYTRFSHSSFLLMHLLLKSLKSIIRIS